MLAIIAAIVTLVAVLATRNHYKKQIRTLIRTHESELSQTYFKSYIKGRKEGFQEGRHERKLAAIRMFN